MPRCANPVCVNGLPEGATSRRRYCSGACRQAAARHRQRPPARQRVAGRTTADLEAAVKRLAGELATAAVRVAAGETDSPLHSQALAGLPRQVHELMRAAVACERAAGTTWGEIGTRLGTDPTTARRRYQPRNDGEMRDSIRQAGGLLQREHHLRLAGGGPQARVWLLRERYAHHAAHATEPFLQMLYGASLWADPGLLPDGDEIAAAVEDVDLDAIDAAYLPLDRAALDLLHRPAWKDAVEPYIAHLSSRPEARAEALHRDAYIYWHEAHRTYRDFDGYPTSRGVPFSATRALLEEAVISVTGGHPPGATVRLHDGRTATVDSARWTRDGAPDHYLVRFPLDAREHTIRADEIAGAQ